MPRRRTVSCHDCGHMLRKGDEDCESCGAMTAYAKRLWTARLIYLGAVGVAFFLMYRMITGLSVVAAG